jgi:hypothetical protein
VEEGSEAAMHAVQIAQHQKTYEITQTDVDEQGIAAGKREGAVLMGNSALSLSVTESLNASQPSSHKRAKQ